MLYSAYRADDNTIPFMTVDALSEEQAISLIKKRMEFRHQDILGKWIEGGCRLSAPPFFTLSVWDGTWWTQAGSTVATEAAAIDQAQKLTTEAPGRYVAYGFNFNLYDDISVRVIPPQDMAPGDVLSTEWRTIISPMTDLDRMSMTVTVLKSLGIPARLFAPVGGEFFALQVPLAFEGTAKGLMPVM